MLSAENDMHNLFGNSALSSGYACLMQKLVSQWRQLWSSAEPGTTAADAPFGIVTLAPSGTEGGSDIGTMRLAQTASYGFAPNPARPRIGVLKRIRAESSRTGVLPLWLPLPRSHCRAATADRTATSALLI